MEEQTKLPIQNCERCLKPIVSKRLNLKYLISDALNSMFNLERGLLYTLVELFKNPQDVIMQFINGNRFKYYNPFRFLVVAATLAVITESITGTISMTAGLNMESSDPEVERTMIEFLRDYQNVLVLSSAPIIAFGTFIIMRKRKWNFAEHLVVNAYGYGVAAILGSIYSFLVMPFPNDIRLALEAVSQLFFFYMTYLYMKVWNIGFFRSLLVLILSTIISSLIAMLIGAIVVTTYLFITK